MEHLVALEDDKLVFADFEEYTEFLVDQQEHKSEEFELD